MAKIVLAGYLGCGNLGDDAVMMGVVERMGPKHEFQILSGDPDETYRQHSIYGVPRKNLKEVDKAIAASDAVIFPGGSIFQDVTSARSTIYYNTIIKIAKKHKKRVLLLNQGVGPLTSWIGKRNALTAFQSADLVVVRDPGSVTTLKGLGVEKKIHVGADSAFLLSPPPKDGDGGTFAVGGMKSIAIAPRPLDKKGVNEAELFGEFCRLLFQAGYAPTLIEMDSAEDGEILEAITKQQKGRIPYLRKLGSTRMVQERLARMETVIAMRLHAGILATTVGVPPLMVSYDPKVAAFSKMLDIGAALPVENLTPTRLFEAFQDHMKSMDSKRIIVEKKRVELSEQAMTAIRLAKELLEPK